MSDLIANIERNPAIALFALGILLIIGAITKGGINLGFVQIPVLEKRQVIILGSVGIVALIFGGILIWKPWESNAPPVVSSEDRDIEIGKTLSVNLLSNDHDPDGDDDQLILIIDPDSLRTLPGKAEKSGRDLLIYTPSDTGTFRLHYSVQDQNEKISETYIEIGVNDPVVPPPPPLKKVTVSAKLIDIFGQAMTGDYKINLLNENLLPPDSIIHADHSGRFEITTNEGIRTCDISIKDELVRLYLNDSVVEYDPIDSIQFTFCRDYFKSDKERYPIDPFENRYAINFEDLKIAEVESSEREWRVLYCGIKFFGTNINDDDKSLNYEIIQEDRYETGKVIQKYGPLPVASGASSKRLEVLHHQETTSRQIQDEPLFKARKAQGEYFF